MSTGSITGDDLYRIFTQGWDAAKAGKDADTNPYYKGAADDEFHGAKHRIWMDGWSAAHVDPVTGDTDG